MPEHGTCEQCLFAEKVYQYNIKRDHLEKKDWRECHRYPPLSVISGLRSVTNGGFDAVNSGFYFPRMDVSQWCGEFRRADPE